MFYGRTTFTACTIILIYACSKDGTAPGSETTNQRPRASITSPVSGTRFRELENIVFTGSGTDAEDGDLTGAALRWQSSQDGRIGQGQTFQHNSLSIGVHEITLTATDSDGAADTATIDVAINQLSVAQREIVYLAFYKGLTLSEIANVLNVTVGTVRTQYHRAKLRLRELICSDSYLGQYERLLG